MNVGNIELSTAERTLLANRVKNQTSVLCYFVGKNKTTPTLTETSILRKENQTAPPRSNSTSLNAFLSNKFPPHTIECTSNNPIP